MKAYFFLFRVALPPKDFSKIWFWPSWQCGRAYINSWNSVTYGMYSCRDPEAPKNYALCEYTECSTVVRSTCKFPFKYKGRLYDTCINIDSNDHWCSTATDAFFNSLPGSKQTCKSACERLTNCPIGFLPMHPDNTCYQDSSSSTLDTVVSFDEAEAKCAEQGARLFKIRSTAALKHLEQARPDHFKTKDFIKGHGESMVAIDLMYLTPENGTNPNLYYRYFITN